MCWTSADWLLWGGCKSFVPSTCFLRSPVDNLSLCLLSKDVWCLKCQNRTRFPSLAVTVQHDVPPGTPAALWCSVHRLPEPPARPGRSKRNDAVGSECKPLTDSLAYTHVYIYMYIGFLDLSSNIYIYCIIYIYSSHIGFLDAVDMSLTWGFLMVIRMISSGKGVCSRAFKWDVGPVNRQPPSGQ